MSGVRNFKQAVKPIIWLNCISCMGVFEIPINRPRYYLSVLYVISTLTVYFILVYKENYLVQKTLIQEIVTLHRVILGVNTLVAIMAIILFWRKSENTNNIIKRNSIVDNTLEALGMKIEYQKTFHSILYLMAIWIVGGIILFIIHVAWMYRDIGYPALYNNMCIYFPILINAVVDLTFTSFIKCVQIKFQQTNTLIDNLVFSANESNAFKIRNRHNKTSIAFVTANYKNHKENVMHFIQTLRHVHLEITRIGWQINHAYRLQLLLEMAVHFIIVTLTSYCLYGVFSDQFSVKFNNERIIAMAVSACLYSLKIILVNGLCASVSAEAYKTGEIIQSFEGSIIDDNMREEIHQFTQQIALNSLNFTAAGFFSIDNSLTGKFFATVMTYVIILIQMNTVV